VSKEIVLSVGRVFHILSLSEPVIRVKSYSPRHPFPRTSYKYTYRFRVPDSPTGFDASCTQFTCEPLELYRWNYVDQYLSTRGEDRTFRLQESLKYWRSRFAVCCFLRATAECSRVLAMAWVFVCPSVRLSVTPWTLSKRCKLRLRNLHCVHFLYNGLYFLRLCIALRCVTSDSDR